MWANGETLSKKGVIFLKILISEFSRFFWNLFWFLLILIPLKNGKKGVYLERTHRADVARRGTRVDATWHARPRGSATRTHESTCVARRWHGRVARPRESMRTPGWHLCGERVTGLASDGPTSIVGPGYSIGAVTHLRYIALSFIRTFFAYFFCVGLCSLLNIYFARHVEEQGVLDRTLTEDSPLIRWILVHWIVNQACASIAI